MSYLASKFMQWRAAGAIPSRKVVVDSVPSLPVIEGESELVRYARIKEAFRLGRISDDDFRLMRRVDNRRKNAARLTKGKTYAVGGVPFAFGGFNTCTR